MLFWEANVRKIQTDGGVALYRDGAVPRFGKKQYRVEPFNQPPFMVSALHLAGLVSNISRIPFRVWLRLTASVADLGIFFLVWKLLTIENRLALSGILPAALSPVLIFVSGFHGNTDSVILLFLLLAIFLVEKGYIELAGAAFGMAINIKIAPLFFAPVILMYLRTLRRRIMFALLTGAIWIAGSMPYLAEAPAVVIRQVFGYGGQSGFWGFAAIAALISDQALQTYLYFGKPLTIAIILVGSWAVHKRAPSASLYQHCGFVGFLLLFTLSGWGSQYLAWLVPWTAVLSWRKVRWHYALLCAFTCGFYPVNMLERVPPRGIAVPALIAMPLWFSVGAMARAIWHENIANPAWEDFHAASFGREPSAGSHAAPRSTPRLV